ncbi:hypothetical protein VTK56DRAFT_375 [Thermocarpiscus australiensis]
MKYGGAYVSASHTVHGHSATKLIRRCSKFTVSESPEMANSICGDLAATNAGTLLNNDFLFDSSKAFHFPAQQSCFSLEFCPVRGSSSIQAVEGSAMAAP